MNIVLFDSSARTDLLPLTYTRPVADLRVGSLTIAEKWARRLRADVSFITQDYLAPLYPLRVGVDNLLIDAAILPTLELVSYLKLIGSNTVVHHDDKLLAARMSEKQLTHFHETGEIAEMQRKEMPHLPLNRLEHPSDIFTLNAGALEEDFELLTAGRRSAELSDTNLLVGPRDSLFLEPGVIMEGCTINVSAGPVYIFKGAVVLEGSLLRGPLSINQGALIKMGARIYGGTTIGPFCRAGGEINNVVMQAHSNKGHDGFLGNAVIGEWCNLGADTNASNLKNDYGNVKTWSYGQRAMRSTGLQFHGLIMGDHSKAGINSMFNTGTVVGFSSNIYGGGFPPAFLPSFSWGGGEGLQPYRLDKAMATAERVVSRRGKAFTETDRRVFETIFNESQAFRVNW